MLHSCMRPTTLHQMATEALAKGLPGQLRTTPPQLTCSSCAQSKQHNATYQRSIATPGTHMHINFCRPLKSISREVFRYFVAYFDEGSRYCIVTGLSTKNQVAPSSEAATLKSSLPFNKTATDFTSDNTEEFYSKHMDSVYNTHNIDAHLTTSHTPQENGKAERINRALMECTRASFLMHRLHPSFWFDALSDVTDKYNCTLQTRSQ